jgi:hypothetical protein
MRPRLRFILVLVIACAAVAPATAVATSTPLGQCTKIDERISGSSVLAFDADWNLLSADIDGEAFGGTVTGLQEVTKITPGGVIHFAGLNYYAGTDYGDFVATTEGIVTPEGKLIFSIQVIDGGPGRFSANGTFALTGDWDVVYKGRICS